MNEEVTQVGAPVEDQPNWAVNILSFCCIPILGIILFFVWKDEKPTAAKWALWSSLAAIGLIILIYIIFGVLGALFSIPFY